MKDWWRRIMRWEMKKRNERRWGIGYYLWVGSRGIRKERLYFETGGLPKSKSSGILLSQYEVMSRPVSAEAEKSGCGPSKSVGKRRKLKTKEADNAAVGWSGRAKDCCWLRQTKLVVVLKLLAEALLARADKWRTIVDGKRRWRRREEGSWTIWCDRTRQRTGVEDSKEG